MGNFWSKIFGGRKQLNLFSTTIQVRSVDLVQPPKVITETHGDGEHGDRKEDFPVSEKNQIYPKTEGRAAVQATPATTVTSTSPDMTTTQGLQEYLEIVVCSPLPHAKHCNKLKMQATAGWETVLEALLQPGATLDVLYNADTGFIHGLQTHPQRA